METSKHRLGVIMVVYSHKATMFFLAPYLKPGVPTCSDSTFHAVSALLAIRPDICLPLVCPNEDLIMLSSPALESTRYRGIREICHLARWLLTMLFDRFGCVIQGAKSPIMTFQFWREKGDRN